MDLGGQRIAAREGIVQFASHVTREATRDVIGEPQAFAVPGAGLEGLPTAGTVAAAAGVASEVYTAEERPGIVLLRQGRYTIQLDEVERKALEQMSRKERRRYAAEHRKVARFRHR
jgi:hypothetical protein